MHRHAVTALVAATALAVAACGSDGGETAPPGAARAAVVAFVTAARDAQYAAACRRLTAGAAEDVKASAVEGFRVDPDSAVPPRDQVKAADARRRTCAGALSLYLGRADLDRVLAAARTAPMRRLGPAVSLGDQAWVVRQAGGAWRIDGYNALADAVG